MSIPIALEALHDEIQGHGSVAFFLSGGGDGRPHCVQLAIAWEDPGRLVLHPGKGTVANVAERPLVSVLWPPTEEGGYSLIVDGTVVDTSTDADGHPTVVVEPTKAVLHRPAKPADPTATAHGSDCVKVFSPTP
ncbi:MAG TPA: hypothetical protein VHT30_06250 [Acidimicrobiales bacterium]|jgi:hypothetical protein|nr:hypothetical protein [Acidimicrobiales bacterium]